ncbi:uncharacterized protein DNG_09792 [Cephalotrichum gorgonifer]|uniref:F-box domain-containing protein n=1 Tax=Cephalotrichum gorgonifer TaxID=2041049 RepID=A0AAE8N843_9PEZI|nr:uncharacterized protein DNG_09792 [Cephalotrichum gorgonifer]
MEHNEKTIGKAGLIDIPNEILNHLATFLTLQHISRLAQASRQYRAVFEEILYQRDARNERPEALLEAGFSGNLGTATKALAHLKGRSLPTLENGWNPLSLAVRIGHKALVKLLLDSDRIDIDINEVDSRSSTLLLHACSSEDPSMVELLLSVGGIDIHKTSSNGLEPLAVAAGAGNLEAVKLLASHDDARLDSKGRFSEPLWYAAGEGHEDVVKFLLDTCKSDAAACNAVGRTPLHRAAAFGKDAVVKLLLAADGVDANAHDGEGCSALHFAAQGGHMSAMKVLLDVGGAELDSKDRFWRTPLMYAAMAGSEDAIKLLLERGADPRAEDDRLNTATVIARGAGHYGVVGILLMAILEIDDKMKEKENEEVRKREDGEEKGKEEQMEDGEEKGKEKKMEGGGEN